MELAAITGHNPAIQCLNEGNTLRLRATGTLYLTASGL